MPSSRRPIAMMRNESLIRGLSARRVSSSSSVSRAASRPRRRSRRPGRRWSWSWSWRAVVAGRIPDIVWRERQNSGAKLTCSVESASDSVMEMNSKKLSEKFRDPVVPYERKSRDTEHGRRGKLSILTGKWEEDVEVQDWPW